MEQPQTKNEAAGGLSAVDRCVSPWSNVKMLATP